MSNLAVAIKNVDGDEDQAELYAGQVEVDQLDAVAEIDGKPVALPQAAFPQRIRNPVAAGVDLPEGEGRSLPFQSSRAGAADEREVEQVEQVHGEMIERLRRRFEI